MSARIHKGTVIEGSSVMLLARVQDSEGDYITQADVDTLTCKVYDANTRTLIDEPELAIADTIHDELVTDDPRWKIDATGFNFSAGLSGDNFPEGNTTYRVEIKVTPVDGDPFYIVYELNSLDVLSE